ncbi:MAG: porin family protein [Legionella sp.]|nr:MAG: porin family protein [Legionella sp.]
MKRSLLTAALLASGIACAATPVDGWYTSIFGGYTYIPGNVNTQYMGILYNNDKYTKGYNAGGRIGYQSNPLRYELEYTYLEGFARNFDAASVQQIDVNGFSSANMFMANVYFDTPEILPSIVPFLGIGIGYTYLQSALNGTNPNTVVVYNFDAKDSEFAYQGTAGLTYNFSENYALNAAYRYVATTHASEFGRNYQVQIASAGFIYRFDRGNYK